MRPLFTCSLIVGLALCAVGRAQAQAPASLAGVVRDSAGRAVANVEILLRDANRGTRTNDRGEFLLDGVAPGPYTVWFRRLGYHSTEYNWAARTGEPTEVNVALHEIPRELDPVIVRADEDKRAAAHASILGLVVDTDGAPIPDAEVQVVGGNMSGVTRSNGGFLFKPLGVGSYVLRARKLGYEPAMVTLQLVQNDDREVVIRMHPLAASLDAVVVTERSGYGRDQIIWEELERRKRWVSFKSRFLGPEDLKSFYGATLDVALIRTGLNGPGNSPRPSRTMHINPGGTRAAAPVEDDGLACVLLNGKDPVRWPLRTFSTNDVELLEIYPSGTELTGTVSDHFHDMACRSLSRTIHPTYYVLWLKSK